MRRARSSVEESGRASLEFLVFGIALIIPVMWWGMSLASVQGATLAAQSAATNAARVFILEQGLADADSAARTAASLALAQHPPASFVRLERTCVPASCLAPGAAVTIRVFVEAPLFSISLLPGILGAESVTVSAHASGVVSRYGVPR